MSERPILFSAPMVRALLAGTKTQKIYAPPGVDPMSPEHLARRLVNGIAEINERECWIWGRTLSSGYGSLTVGGRTIRAHRLVLALSLCRDERSLDEVCHRCDDTRCVNPDHLFEGTHADNVRDAVAKGRARPPIGPRLCGQRNPAAKLSDADVVAVRAALSRGERQAVVASRHGVSQSTVSQIARGKTRHA